MKLTARVLIILAFLAVLALVFAGYASAASRDDVQRIADRTEAWMSRSLGVAPLNRPIVIASDDDLAVCARFVKVTTCDAAAWWDRISLSGDVYLGVLEVADWSDPYPAPDVGAFQILVHELLHRGTGHDRLEEGLVDALAWDITPAATRAVIGITLRARPPLYGSEVHMVRKASALACGCRWQDRGARGLRRAWWAADDATRHAVIADALAR